MLLGAMACTTAVVAQEQDYMLYHSCDFTDGIPADYATYDLDGQTLHFTMEQGGVAQGEAWAQVKERGTDNYYAASACRYKEQEGVELKPSDDWLILPAVWVRAADATLSWDAMTVKSRQNDCAGYEVLLSTTGNTPDHFTSEPLFSTTDETLGEWTARSVSLADYVGQNVYIAFHNNSTKGDFIAVDNIAIGGHRGVCHMTVTTGSHVYGTTQVPVSVSITSYSEQPITHADIYYRYKGETITHSLTDLNIAKYGTFTHTFDTPIEAAYADTVHYTVGAVVNDVQQGEIECATVLFYYNPGHKVVVEEGTGLWCGFCPAGIVAAEILSEKYPEQFLCLAVHQGDVVAVNDYATQLNFASLPAAYVNRRYLVSPPMVTVENNGVEEMVTTNGGLETYFVKELERIPAVGVNIESVAINGDDITIESCVASAIDIFDVQYQLALVLVENNVWGEGYAQNNEYAGDDVVIGGWEDRPSVVTTDFMLQDVVRCIYDDYQGIAGTIPATLLMGEKHNNTHTYKLPTTILNMENVKVVAMIIDTASGAIVNACETDALAAVETLHADEVHCYATAQGIVVATPAGAPTTIQLHNLSGSIVGTYNTTGGQAQLSVPASGIYLVTVHHNATTTTHKVIVK